jgi:hypothetical protein
MLPSTQTAILSTSNAVLCADPSITVDELNHIKTAIRDALTGKTDKPAEPTAEPLIKRAEVARLAGISLISVDRYGRLGFITRVRLGDSSRATGYTAESVRRFLAGRAESASGAAAQ